MGYTPRLAAGIEKTGAYRGMLLHANISKSRYFVIILSSLFFASSAAAQLTTVSGTVTDPNNIPYAGGQLKVQLVAAAGGAVTGQPTVTVSNQAQCVSGGFGSSPCQVPFQGTVGSFQLSPTGTFTVNLQDNTLVTPAGTQWLFTVTIAPGVPPPLGFGPQTCIAQLTISGPTQSVSAAVSAVCPALTTLTTATGIGAGSVVTNFSYAQSGLDQLHLGTVTNPTSTPLLTLTAQPTQAGMVLAGPVPSGTPGTNPFFETATISNGASATISTSGTPLSSTSAALFFCLVASGSSHCPAPTGYTTVDNTTVSGGAVYRNNLSSSANVTVTSAISSQTWIGSLAFLGGSITSVPHSTALFTGTCGTGCATGTLSSVTAGNTIVLFVTFNNSATDESGARVLDSSGDSYSKMAATGLISDTPNIQMVTFVAQNVQAGTHTITITGSASFTLHDNVQAYELAGPTAYYSGPNGPYAFRFLTQADLGSVPITWANLLPGTNTSTGTFTQSGGVMDFSGSTSFKNPISAGAAPTADGALATNTTTHGLNFGSNATTVNVAAASTGAGGTGTSCAAGSAVTAISNTVAPTCTALVGSGTGTAGVQVFSATTLGGDVSVSATTATTVMTRAVTMPASGCPCRAFLSYSLYITTASSGVGYSAWVNDGSANMAGTNAGQSNGSSGALTSLSYGGYSTVTYANGANVTFTLTTEGDHTYTVKAASQLAGSAPNSSFQVAVSTSN